MKTVASSGRQAEPPGWRYYAVAREAGDRGCKFIKSSLFGIWLSSAEVRMALTTGVTRDIIITDDSPMAISIQLKTHANIILRDVQLIQNNFESSGPHILLAHAI